LWSLGVIVFVLLAGYMPFAGADDQSQRERILAGNYYMKPGRWNIVSNEAKNFMQSLLQTDPSLRLTAKAALKHSWITMYNTPSDDGEIGLTSNCVNALREFGKASTFKRVSLKAMAWLLSNEETEQVRQQFAALDVDCGGTITLTELQHFLLDRCNLAKSDVNAIFRAVDMNHDEEIYYSEFLAAMLSASINISDQLLQTAFRHFDTDLSGYITSDDLREVLGGHVFEGKTAEALIQDADVLKDGRISFPEFAAFMRDEPLKTSAPLFDQPVQRTVIIEELEDSTIEKSPPCCCVQ
jgi:calcium-dependent protein kinase